MTLDFDFSVLYAIRDAFASGKADDLMRAITMLGDGGFIKRTSILPTIAS